MSGISKTPAVCYERAVAQVSPKCSSSCDAALPNMEELMDKYIYIFTFIY